MPRIATVDIGAKNRTATNSRGYRARAPFREALANLTSDRQLEIVPDEGETLRGVMLSLARAAKEVNRDVDYGQTEEGTLIVWLRDKPRQRRGPRKNRSVAGEERSPSAL